VGDDSATKPVRVVLRVTNAKPEPLPFGFEPWGQEHTLAPSATFEVVGQGPPNDGFEVVIGPDYVEVWGWWGSNACLLSEGVEVSRGAFRVPAAPAGNDPAREDR
jgi:hypothetical protein